jgi:hypothetical protein
MRKGETKYTKIFFPGKKIGRWTVTGGFKQCGSKGGDYFVLAKCECGYEHYVNCFRLSNGKARGCKCAVKGSNSSLWKGIGIINGSLINQIKQSARIRNLEYKLTKKDLLDLLTKQQNRCILTGLDLVFSSDKHKHTASLDRIDSSKGYVNGNVIWIHKHANIMKNVFEMGYFLDLCKKIESYGRKNLQDCGVWKRTNADQTSNT